ncbi:type II toxin-antitoxin system CcdA family antitoxin [Aquipuribacter sp. SD81]|uniref:type II toxin-antitoxin system CcdA family antitoxin n=1 Tax=Aquipuribacter sp. SD81 TaxID=3127703 RepID=UPI0030163A0C
MPKVSVYLPDDLAAEVRARELSLSALVQRAVEAEIRTVDRERWLARMRRLPFADHDVDVVDLVREVRGEGRT